MLVGLASVMRHGVSIRRRCSSEQAYPGQATPLSPIKSQRMYLRVVVSRRPISQRPAVPPVSHQQRLRSSPMHGRSTAVPTQGLAPHHPGTNQQQVQMPNAEQPDAHWAMTPPADPRRSRRGPGYEFRRRDLRAGHCPGSIAYAQSGPRPFGRHGRRTFSIGCVIRRRDSRRSTGMADRNARLRYGPNV